MLLNKPSQEQKILKVLEDRRGEWVSARYFVQTMMISQTSARITKLRQKGYEIETSPKRKENYGFCDYRLKPLPGTLNSLF